MYTVAQGSQFSLNDCEVITATVDLEEVRSHRFAPSRGMQSVRAPEYKRIDADFSLSSWNNFDPDIRPSRKFAPKYHSPEEEIAMGPACWMWDYLRRSKAAGLLVPLVCNFSSPFISFGCTIEKLSRPVPFFKYIFL